MQKALKDDHHIVNGCKDGTNHHIETSLNSEEVQTQARDPAAQDGLN